MGMVQPDLKIVLDERDIKASAIIRNDDLIFLDVLNEIIQALPLNISFDRLAIIKRNGCYFVELAVKSGSFNVKICNRISELGK
jgi:hypothetical protein